MNVLMPEGRMRMFHERDPKEVLLETIKKNGGIEKLKLMSNNILVAIYKRPEKTKSGIIVTDNTRREDIWQGKVGLVVAMGPKAFVDDDTVKFLGERVEIGDWVWFRPSDSIHCEVNGVQMRVLKEYAIMGVIPDPDYVF